MSQDITKLPKWAQNEIHRLAANAEHYKKAAMEMDIGESNVYQRDYGGFPDNDRRAMKRDSHILFVTENAEFDVGFRDGVLEVTSTGRLSDRLIVRPISSNVVAIEGWGR